MPESHAKPSGVLPQQSPYADAWDLSRDVHFLNHGSFGACPRELLERQRAWQTRLEAQPVQFLARDLEPLLDDVRATLGSFLGADPDDLALVQNATAGVNTVLRSLRLEPGDELLVTNHEYNACRMALDMIAERAGAKVVLTEIPFPLCTTENAIDSVIDAIVAKATNKTKLLLIDQITSPTGLVMPIREIVAAMNARGIDTLVDGAHAPGMLPLELDSMGAAYWTGNAHKWLCTPKGAAVLWVRRDRQDGIRPLSIGHGANAKRDDRSRFRLEFDWPGTADPSAHLVIPDAIGFLHRLSKQIAEATGNANNDRDGLGALRAHNHDLVVTGRQTILDALQVQPVMGGHMPGEAACPDTMLGSLATLVLPDLRRSTLTSATATRCIITCSRNTASTCRSSCGLRSTHACCGSPARPTTRRNSTSHLPMH